MDSCPFERDPNMQESLTALRSACISYAALSLMALLDSLAGETPSEELQRDLAETLARAAHAGHKTVLATEAAAARLN